MVLRPVQTPESKEPRTLPAHGKTGPRALCCWHLSTSPSGLELGFKIPPTVLGRPSLSPGVFQKVQTPGEGHLPQPSRERSQPIDGDQAVGLRPLQRRRGPGCQWAVSTVQEGRVQEGSVDGAGVEAHESTLHQGSIPQMEELRSVGLCPFLLVGAGWLEGAWPSCWENLDLFSWFFP